MVFKQVELDSSVLFNVLFFLCVLKCAHYPDWMNMNEEEEDVLLEVFLSRDLLCWSDSWNKCLWGGWGSAVTKNKFIRNTSSGGAELFFILCGENTDQYLSLCVYVRVFVSLFLCVSGSDSKMDLVLSWFRVWAHLGSYSDLVLVLIRSIADELRQTGADIWFLCRFLFTFTLKWNTPASIPSCTCVRNRWALACLSGTGLGVGGLRSLWSNAVIRAEEADIQSGWWESAINHWTGTKHGGARE